jgi:hypothetical protein
MIYRTNALVPAGVLAALGFAMLAVLAPLATYTVSLAAFGLPHVLSELLYIPAMLPLSWAQARRIRLPPQQEKNDA